MRIPGVPYVQGRNAYADRDSRKYGIAIHNTSNDASAEGEASYATRRTDGVSAHLYCDADSVVQSLNTDSRAGHAGSYEGNEHAIAVEITGVNSWTRQQWLDRVAWAKLGAALAYLCKAYGISVRRASVSEMRSNPKVKAFYGHDDMRRAWGGTTHTDPGPNFPWDRLFQAVNAAGEDDDMAMTAAERAAFAEEIAGAVTDQWLGNSGPTVGVALQSTYGTVQTVAGAVTRLGEVVAAESSNPDEVRAALSALPTPPTAEEVAEATVRRLGEESPDAAAQTLLAVLGPDRTAALGAALTAAATQG